MAVAPLSSWSRERTRLLTEEHKIRLALVVCVGAYLFMRPETIVRPAPVLAALGLMLVAAAVFILGIRTHRLAAAIGFETATAVLTVVDLLNITLLVAGTGGAASGFYLLYLVPLIFAAAFFRGMELAFLTGLAGLFYGLMFLATPEALWATLAVRLTGCCLIVWQAYALTNVLHREKQGNDQLLRHMAEGVIVLDDGGRVVLANNAFASMLGVSAPDLEGASTYTMVGDNPLLEWVVRDSHGPNPVVQRSTRTGQFPDQDLPLLEVTTISCREQATRKGGWVIVCRDLRDVTGDPSRTADEGCDAVSPLANLRALSQTLYALAERLDDSERWRAVSLIEQHTIAMQAILTRLLQQGGEELNCGLDNGVVNVSGLLSSTRRVLEIRDLEVEVSLELDLPSEMPEIRAERGPLGRLLLRMARSLLHYARPLDRLVLSARPDGDRMIIGVELCPPPPEMVASPVLEHLHRNIGSQLRQDMEELSRLLVLCGAVWTLRRGVGDYYQLEVSVPLDIRQGESPLDLQGFERPELPLGVEFLADTTLNRLNNILGVIRGRAEFALMWPQPEDSESVLIATMEKADEASEVLEMVMQGMEVVVQPNASAGDGSLMAARPQPLITGALPVLIVDDEKGVRELLAAMLSTCGCETAEAADAQEAIDYLLEQRPALAIVDLYMPGARGTEVLKKARQMYPDLPVVMMSGGGVGGVNDALAEHHPNAILSKPFGLNEVIDLARQVQAAG